MNLISLVLMVSVLQTAIATLQPSASPTPEPKDDGDAATIFTEDGTEIAWERAPEKSGTFKVKKAGKAAQELGWKKGDEVAGDGTGPWREDVHEALSALKELGTGTVKRENGSLELPYFFASNDHIESSPHGLRPMKEAFGVLGTNEKGTFDIVKESRGKVLLLNFWASWCGPCRKEMPVMERLSHSYAGRVWFVGLNVDQGRSEVVEFLKENPITYPTVMVGTMRGMTAKMYHVESIPLTVIVRPDGRIALVGSGYRGERHEQWISDALDTLLDPSAMPVYIIHKPSR